MVQRERPCCRAGNPTGCPWWFYVGTYLLAVLFFGWLSLRLPGPLDVDGAYYFLVARGLAQGDGWRIPALWLFFRPPPELPQAVGELWLPMPSLLLVPSLLLGNSFRHAQVGQAALAAFLPLLALRTGLDLGLRPRWAGAAVLFALLTGTVTVHWVDTDSFTAFALLAGGCLWTAGRAAFDRRFLILAGVLGGLAALARNDGWLLLPILWASAWLYGRRSRVPPAWKELWLGSLLFLVPPGVWALRNLFVFGAPSAVPLLYVAALLDYRQLLRWHPQPDWTAFLHQGWNTLASLRLEAGRASFTVLAAMFQLWGLGPVALAIARLRRREALWPAFLYLAILFVTLVSVFPLLVTHGTWSRSVSAFVPAGAATLAAGCSDLEALLSRRMRGRRAGAVQVLLFSVVILLIALVGSTALMEQLKSAVQHPLLWQRIGRLLTEPASSGVVMAQDPMAVLLYAGRPAIGVPYEESPLLLEIAQRYNVRTLVLVDDLKGLLPETLRSLYEAGTNGPPGFSSGPFTLVRREDGIQVYELR